MDDDSDIPMHKFELIALNDVYKIARDVTNFNTMGDFKNLLL